MQTPRNPKISGAAVNVAAVAVVCSLILIGAARSNGPAHDDGGNCNSTSQLDSKNLTTNGDSDHKRVTFVRPEVQVTNDIITVVIATDTPMAQGEHLTTILETPYGALRTHKFSAVTNGAQTSSVLSWQFDSKRDGVFLAAAQDALTQLGTRLKAPQTLSPCQVLPVFTVTNSIGGIMRGSIEYHVHSPNPMVVPPGSLAVRHGEH